MPDEVNELFFTALGPSGAGKTTMLACMQRKFKDELEGFFVPASKDTFSTLKDAYDKLESEANAPELYFEVPVEGTEELRQYPFILRARKGGLPVRFFDFPGGWMNADDPTQAENYEQVVRIVQKSMVVIVAVNTPYIMEYSDSDKAQKEMFLRHAGVENINYILTTNLQSDTDKLILFVPIKCEKYTQNAADREKLRGRVKELFAETLRLADNPLYKGRLAIAFMPIHTVGNARFSKFSFSDGIVEREVYTKNRQMGFKPHNAEQPFLFAMSFLLNEFAKGANPMLNGLFRDSDMGEIGDFIHERMNLDDDDFEIFCGRELIADNAAAHMPPPPVQQPQHDTTAPQTQPVTAHRYDEPNKPRTFAEKIKSPWRICLLAAALACAVTAWMSSIFWLGPAAALAVLGLL